MTKAVSSDSSVNTVTLPATGGGDPTSIASAVGRPFRVAVSNIGPNPVLVAYDVGALQNQPAIAGTYLIQTGKDQVFVLQAGQRLFGAGVGAGAVVSVAISVAVDGWFSA